MFRGLLAALAGLSLSGLSLAAAAAPPPEIRLWRLDGGVIQEDHLSLYSDTFAYEGRTRRLPVSCYLIRHGQTWMLWDTGLPDANLGLPLRGPGAKGETVATLLVDQLARLGVTPAQIALIGISHYDYDHTGQTAHFPQARVLLGQADIEALRRPGHPDAALLARWLSGPGQLDPVSGDRDVFGDGSVIMLDLPGHTPGHHGLLVRLADRGPVLLSGDLAHFRENYDTNGVPQFNVDRSRSLASLDRFKKIAANLHATVIIQHEENDIPVLPAFPDFAH